MNLQEDLLSRFLRYVQIDTPVMPEYAGRRCPTSPGQLKLAALLRSELDAMNIPYYHDEKGFIIASLKGNKDVPSIALMAHLDVSNDVPGMGVKPQVYRNYDVQKIVLKDDVVLDPEKDKALQACIGDTIVTSDGTTLLGSDDKAGIAAIMSMLQYFALHPDIERGDVEAVFTPDEEGGDGMNHFPLKELRSKIAYTIDAGGLGEINYECYHAYTVHVHFEGVAIHPGSARGVMVNALSMLAAFINMIPRSESPEATDGYYGCYWPADMRGGVEEADLTVMVRDHDREEAHRRLEALQGFAHAVMHAFPGGKVTIESRLSYANMGEAIEKNKIVMQRLLQAMGKLDIAPVIEPIRGGTDGARLTAMGVPCPNIFTGGHNMHSRKEWLSLNALEKVCLLAIELVKG